MIQELVAHYNEIREKNEHQRRPHLRLDVECGTEEAKCQRGVAVELEAVQMMRLCDGGPFPETLC